MKKPLKTTVKQFFSHSKKNKFIALFVAILVLIVGYVVMRTNATGFFVTFEPESGSLSSNITSFFDSSASNGGGIKFGSGASTSCALPKYPDASCTGYHGTSLTETLDGQIDINTAGTVLERKVINGCVVVNAPNVTIRQVVINCATGDGIYNNSTGLVIEDSDISCDDRVGGTGITWQNYTVRRVNVHDCDNVFWAEYNVVIEDSYIHDPICYNVKTDPHTDSIQIPDTGSNVTIRHNTIYGNYSTVCDIDNDGKPDIPSFGNSAITSTSGGALGGGSNVLIVDNLLAGGGYTLYCPNGKGNNFRVINNHFSTVFAPTVGGYGPWLDCQDEAEVTGNVYHETLKPVPF